MRRKIGVILMVVATAATGTSEVSRQFGNLRASVTEWTANNFQPGLLVFAASTDEATGLAGRAVLVHRLALPAEQAQPAVQPSTVAARRSGKKAVAEKGFVAQTPGALESANHRIAGLAPAVNIESRKSLRKALHEVSETWSESQRAEREVKMLVRAFDDEAIMRELEKLAARKDLPEPARLMQEASKLLRIRIDAPAPPSARPSAAAKVRRLEVSRLRGWQTDARRENSFVRRIYAAEPVAFVAQPPAAEVDPLAAAECGPAADQAGLSCQDDPRR